MRCPYVFGASLMALGPSHPDTRRSGRPLPSAVVAEVHPLERPKVGEPLAYARPGDTVHISEMFRRSPAGTELRRAAGRRANGYNGRRRPARHGRDDRRRTRRVPGRPGSARPVGAEASMTSGSSPTGARACRGTTWGTSIVWPAAASRSAVDRTWRRIPKASSGGAPRDGADRRRVDVGGRVLDGDVDDGALRGCHGACLSDWWAGALAHRAGSVSSARSAAGAVSLRSRTVRPGRATAKATAARAAAPSRPVRAAAGKSRWVARSRLK